MTTGANGSGRSHAGDARFALIVAAVFCVLCIVGMSFHELWRDEWQAWLLARDSSSLGALLYNTRYEGHPPTWHILLFGLSRLTRSVVAMQALHVVIATATVWTFVRFAPFARVYRALFVFGYYPAYEYAVISRSYSLGALALFAACIAWQSRRRSYIPLAACLVLLALTSIYGVILTLAFGSAVVGEWLLDPDTRAVMRRRLVPGVVAIMLVVIGLIVAVRVARPPTDAGFAGRSAQAYADTPIEALRLVAFLPVRTLVPLPRFRDGTPVWGQTAIVEGPGLPNSPLIGIVLGLCLAMFAARRLSAFILLATGTTGLLLFAFLFHYGHLRHHGHLILLIGAAFWLALLPGEDGRPYWLRGAVGRRLERIGWAVFVLVLAVQNVTFAIYYVADLRYAFSEGEAAARVLAAEGALEGVPVLATNGAYGSTLAGYLDRPIRYMDERSEGTFMVWGRGREMVPNDSVFPRAAALMPPDRSTLLLAVDRPLPPSPSPPGFRVEPLETGAGPVLAPEIFDLYRITRVTSPPR